MSEINYESMWWGYIYDQMMKQDLSDQLDDRLRFYRLSLRQVTGPILECGCGTGLIFLPLLADGFDIYGFDISKAMLNMLKRKAEAEGFEDMNRRISVQDLESFHYDQVFDAITIPSNTFSMLTTQDAQIKALKNIHAHLVPKGKLFLDLHLVGMRELAEGDIESVGNWHTWTHPETGHPIRQRVDARGWPS